MKKKLNCHCGSIEAEVEVPEKGIEKVLRCNCSICKKKGYIIGVLGPNDFKLIKGEEFLKLISLIRKLLNIIFVLYV